MIYIVLILLLLLLSSHVRNVITIFAVLIFCVYYSVLEQMLAFKILIKIKSNIPKYTRTRSPSSIHLYIEKKRKEVKYFRTAKRTDVFECINFNVKDLDAVKQHLSLKYIWTFWSIIIPWLSVFFLSSIVYCSIYRQDYCFNEFIIIIIMFILTKFLLQVHAYNAFRNL